MGDEVMGDVVMGDVMGHSSGGDPRRRRNAPVSLQRTMGIKPHKTRRRSPTPETSYNATETTSFAVATAAN